MSHAITVSDEDYEIIAQHAVSKGPHPDDLVAEWIADLRETPTFFETDDWFRHLGATEEQIAEARQLADARIANTGHQTGPTGHPEDEGVAGTADANT